MPTRFDPATGGLSFTPQEKDNEIIIKSKDDFPEVLDSGSVYFIDGQVDMEDTEILVPSGGLYIFGHGYGISELFTTSNSKSLFKTPNAKHTISSDRTGGTFTLTYDGQTTSALNWNATAAQVDTALEALSNIGSGDVTCTGGDLPTDIVVEFTGALAQTDVALITVTDSGTGGTGVTVTETIAGYAGDFISGGVTYYVTGTSSKIFDVDNAGNNSAIEFNTTNLGKFGVTTTSLGTIANYRQVRTGDFAAIAYNDGFTFDGTFSGMTFSDSILLGNVAGTTFLQEGTSLSITAGVSSDMNALSLGSGSEWCDFDAANFATDAVMSLNGFRTNLSTAIPNLSATDIKAMFKGCVGIDNTFVGGSWSLTTEAATTVTTNKTLVKLAGTTTADLDAHFTMPANNRLQYNGERDIKVDVLAYCQLSSAGTESFEIEARHWDSSGSSWNDIRTLPVETVLKILGDRRGGGTIIATADMSTGDYIELWALDASAAGTANPTLEIESTITVSER